MTKGPQSGSRDHRRDGVQRLQKRQISLRRRPADNCGALLAGAVLTALATVLLQNGMRRD